MDLISNCQVQINLRIIHRKGLKNSTVAQKIKPLYLCETLGNTLCQTSRLQNTALKLSTGTSHNKQENNTFKQYVVPNPSWAYEPGGRGGLQPPQLQKFLKFFGQKADDSGKSTREKTL